MRNRIIQLILILNAALLVACGSTNQKGKNSPAISDGKASAGTVKLYLKLQHELDKGIMLGHQDDLAYGYKWFQERGRSDVKSVCGDYPAVFGWDIGNIEHGSRLNGDSIAFATLIDYVREVLDIPLQLQVLSIIAIGHKGMERKPFNEEHLQWEKIHLNKYGGNDNERGEGEQQ